jgi:hypothetical protein
LDDETVIAGEIALVFIKVGLLSSSSKSSVAVIGKRLGVIVLHQILLGAFGDFDACVFFGEKTVKEEGGGRVQVNEVKGQVFVHREALSQSLKAYSEASFSSS